MVRTDFLETGGISVARDAWIVSREALFVNREAHLENFGGIPY